MSADSPENTPWSQRRWVASILVLFVIHLGAFHFLSPKTSSPARVGSSQLTVRWLTEPAHAKRVLDTLLLDDPTLMAMASPRGFSGAAWLRPQPALFQATQWADAERSLSQPIGALGDGFRKSAELKPTVIEPLRQPTSVVGNLTERTALRTNSQLLVEGPLRERAAGRLPKLGSRPVADVLADTRVQVLVSAEGMVVSPRLASATAARNPAQWAADQDALKVARTLRFAPLPKAGSQGPGTLVEGTLVFRWHSVPPPPVTEK